jgi:SAM-dependent methyltransferase
VSSLGERFVDVIARRPSGRLGRRTYGDAPKAHEASFRAVMEWLGPITGEECLEIGFGGVLVERALAAGATRVAGIDHSPDLVKVARQRNEAAVASGQADPRLGDAGSLPWPEHSFDAAFSSNVFFFIEEPERVLGELYRVLHPGGRLVIATMVAQLPTPSLRRWWLYGPMGRALRVYTEAEMAAMYEKAGFRNVRIESTGDSENGLYQMSRGFRPTP